jgi:hypothetical protein
VLVELSVMEQRYQAVLAVTQDGWKFAETANDLLTNRAVGSQDHRNVLSGERQRTRVLLTPGEGSAPVEKRGA